MQLKLMVKYDVFFSNKTYLRNSCLLVIALAFTLFSVAPSFVMKFCCELNLCKNLHLGMKKKKAKRSPHNTRYLQSWLKHLHVLVYWANSVQGKATVFL